MPYRNPAQRAVTPQGAGRFGDFDVLEEVRRWDDVTAGVVLARLAPSTDLSFFDLAETAAASALCDLLLAQDAEPRVPVVALIDARLALGETDGWHYDDMPDDATTWRDSLRALDADAHDLGAERFAALDVQGQTTVVQRIQDLGSGRWRGLHAGHLWSLWTRYVCAAYYSHPWAWNEIGFGGPAYPRGYKNRGIERRERWEVRDRSDEDPVPFAERVERARRAHEKLLGDR